MYKKYYLQRISSLAACLLFVVSLGISVIASSGTAHAAIIGDLNNDGAVTTADLSILLANYGKSGTGDLNGNGTVGAIDLSILLSKLNVSAGTGTFTVSGTKILGPDGKEFIPMGANFTGPYFVWQDNLLASGRMTSIKDRWRFNTMSINLCFESVGGCSKSTGEISVGYNKDAGYLDKVIDTYTKAGIVVILSQRQVKTGKYPNDAGQVGLTKVKDWWVEKATKYKTNPYVWFDLLTEAGYPQEDVMADETVYRDTYKTLVSAVRDTAKANNIILVQGSQYGNDTYASWKAPMPKTTTPSASEISAMDAHLKRYSGLLTFGDDIRGNYKNIVFDIHAYSGWGANSAGQTNTQRDNLLGRYIDLIHQMDVPLVVGEFGGCNYYDPPGVDDSKTSCADTGKPEDDRKTGIAEGYTSQSLFRVAPKKKVGLIFWHSLGYDRRVLIEPQPGSSNTTWSYYNVNSATTPTNLSWQGKLLWDATRNTTFAPPRP